MTLRPTAGCATHSPLRCTGSGTPPHRQERSPGARASTRAWRRGLSRRALFLGTLGAAAACAPGDGAPSADRNAQAQSTVGVSPAPAPSADTSAPSATAAALVGRRLDDVVPDSALFGSWAVYPVERRIGIRHVVLDGQHLLLADTLDGYDGDRARWRIRQVQPVDALRPGEGYVASCALPGADAADGTVVARVTLSPDESLTAVHAAWRLDPSTWRFAPFPTDSLSCFNEGGGP